MIHKLHYEHIFIGDEKLEGYMQDYKNQNSYMHYLYCFSCKKPFVFHAFIQVTHNYLNLDECMKYT